MFTLTPVWRLKDSLSVLELGMSDIGAPSAMRHLHSTFPSLQGPFPSEGLAKKGRPVFHCNFDVLVLEVHLHFRL